MQPTPRSTHTQAPASSPPVTPAMRTLALLAALLLLALQAQAEPLPENNEEAPDQEQPGEEDQDMAISFSEAEAPGVQRSAAGQTGKCRCAIFGCTIPGERNAGRCKRGGLFYSLCCY
ncbi:defensin alpha 5-like [Marmota monax]|uniref:defensin alpha 5-like n=1 Tax=Marmota monax TaxID=9995 RepID=UPI0026E9C95E|nr:defensin alpha 5-like [Marmota monax]